MKKTMLLICILFISQISIANPLSWIKNKIGDVWFTYKTWNIPRPRLIGHQKMELDGKKFEEFVYLLREDNVVVKDVRKKLHVSGIYLSNDSDVDVYKVSRQKFPVPKHYIENGFDINQNNSVSAGMFRLLNYWEYIVHPIMPNEDVEPFIQLLWEVEDCLPKDFDEDESGMQFVTFIRKMFDREIPKIKVKEENWEEYSMERKRTMINYLSVWQHYSLRFRNNKGLDRAFKYFLVNENIF